MIDDEDEKVVREYIRIMLRKGMNRLPKDASIGHVVDSLVIILIGSIVSAVSENNAADALETLKEKLIFDINKGIELIDKKQNKGEIELNWRS